MRAGIRLAALVLTLLALVLLRGTAAAEGLRQRAWQQLEVGRMKNVQVTDGGKALLPAAAPLPTPAPVMLPLAAPAGEDGNDVRPLAGAPDDEVLETTIQGGLSIKNETELAVDAGQLLAAGPSVRLPAEGPQILLIHTHASEAYTPAGLDRYEANDSSRTADRQYNIVRVGDELAARLEEAGLTVLHDREIYDYPSYTGSYTRSGEAVQRYLEEYPDIAVVIDIHRDALGSGGVVYKTMAEESGVCASQVMLLVGTDESGLEHPNWRSNLALALYLQDAVSREHPTLMRPVALVPQRYNQHLTGGSLILEVGSSGNTLQEALAAIRLFADAAGPALQRLAQPPAEGAEGE